MPGSGPKVLVAMSGGVDSSVAAAMLRREGYDVVGVFMRLGSPGETLDELAPLPGPTDAPGADRERTPERDADRQPVKIGHQGCCSILDAADARLVAAELGIPFYVCNFKKDFGRIIEYFADEYAQGRTPNPCVRCNDWLKFGKLHEYARSIGAEFVASGHYARCEEGTLARGLDHAKDQSYVLFGIPREQLARTLFPVGGLPKSEVRALARRWGLPVFDKPDSQEICFVPDNNYAALVERLRPELATGGGATRAPGGATAEHGRIVDEHGRVLGAHHGQHHFTVGQRRGLGVSATVPLYVLNRDAATNTVTVGPRERLAASACDVGEANWLLRTGDARDADLRRVLRDADGLRASAQFRAHGSAAPARVTLLDDAPDAADARGAETAPAPGPSGRTGRFRVHFDAPQFGVAPGQALVLYAGDRVLGGGWIRRTQRADATAAPADAPSAAAATHAG